MNDTGSGRVPVTVPPEAIGRLREALVARRASPTWQQIVEPKDRVFARFQPIFARDYLPRLTAEEFRPFLYFEHNHHWSGLHRQVNRICADMARLRQVLLTLTDETRQVEERLDEVGESIVGLGKGIITAILTVAFPSKYGVWNSTSEAGLLQLGLWPEFERGASFGTRYARINAILLALAAAVDVDLWTLDALWWQLAEPAQDSGAEEMDAPVPVPDAETRQQFGMERHLHDFLYDNWSHTTLGREWNIFALPGEPDAGYEYTCAVGRIDILARHRTAKKWLIVELKRNETSDSAVGQALRYMGWVRQHLADSGDEVRGLIIARSGDVALQYAVSAVPGLEFMTYEVEFHLNPPPPLAK